jgi:biopolymer transport protein ExbD
MNQTQKFIVMLLVLAILFSATSIFVSFSALNIDIPQRAVAGSGANSGGVNLVVEDVDVDVGGDDG